MSAVLQQMYICKLRCGADPFTTARGFASGHDCPNGYNNTTLNFKCGLKYSTLFFICKQLTGVFGHLQRYFVHMHNNIINTLCHITNTIYLYIQFIIYSIYKTLMYKEYSTIKRRCQGHFWLWAILFFTCPFKRTLFTLSVICKLFDHPLDLM